jgi:hypothetical protein
MHSTVSMTIETHGRIDVVVHNAARFMGRLGIGELLRPSKAS